VGGSRRECYGKEGISLIDTIIASMPGVVYLFGEPGKLMRWNRNLECISGYSSEEVALITRWISSWAAERIFTDEEARFIPGATPGRTFVFGSLTLAAEFLRRFYPASLNRFLRPKSLAKAPGSGLATVFGIVKKHGGVLVPVFH